MKRILSLTLVVAILVTALVSCDIFSIFGKVADEGDVTVVVETADGSYEVYKAYLESVENKEEGAKGVLEYLRDRGEASMHLIMDSTAFVTEIGSIKQDTSAGAYVMIYTSIASDSYEGAPSVDYDGIKLYQSGFGIKDMTVTAGTVMLFRVEVYA